MPLEQLGEKMPSFSLLALNMVVCGCGMGAALKAIAWWQQEWKAEDYMREGAENGNFRPSDARRWVLVLSFTA
jgi:hypothetical protein